MKVIPKISRVNATVVAPPSKSYSVRALLLAAMAEGTTTVTNCLDADDTRYALEAIRAMGFEIHGTFKEGVSVVPRRSMSANEVPISVGNAGTAMRFRTGWLTFMPGRFLLSGEKRMHERPIGDLVGGFLLAHAAAHEGIVAAEDIAGKRATPMEQDLVTRCTYSDPQIASVGLTEPQARERGHEVKVGKFPFIGNGKAIAMGEPEGMIKTVFDGKTGELLGAHMVGAEVTEMIQGYTIARTLETTETELINTVFPHPTVSETMHEAVLDAYKRAIHF